MFECDNSVEVTFPKNPYLSEMHEIFMEEMKLWQTTLCASEPKCTRKTEPRTKRNTWFYCLPGQAVVFRNQKSMQRKGLWGFTGKYRISLVLAGIASVLPARFITFPGLNRVPERKGQEGRKRGL